MNKPLPKCINEAFKYLTFNGLVKNQSALAKSMGTSAANVSFALKGDEKYLTKGFITRFNNASGNIFNEAWLLTGEGPMLREGIATDTIYNKESSPGSIQIATSNHKGDNIIASRGDAEKQQNAMTQQGTEKTYDTFLQNLVERLMSTNERLTATNEKLTDEISSIRSILEQQSAKMREMESALGCPDAHSSSTSTEQNVGMKGVG